MRNVSCISSFFLSQQGQTACELIDFFLRTADGKTEVL